MDQDQSQQTAPDPNAEPSDAELIAAAQEVGGAASVDVAAEAAAAGQPSPAPPAGAAAQPAGEPEEPKIAAILRAREKAFAERQEATDYAAQVRRQAEAEAQKVLAEARARAVADYEAEVAARRARFRESPTAAIRELGFPTEDIVDSVTREGTAEWKAIRAAELRAQAAEQKAGTVDSVKKEFEEFKTQLQMREHEQAVRAVEQQFLTVYAAPEKAPYLHKRYEPEEIIQKAHALANQWRQAGVAFAHSDVAEYLEHQARQRLAGATSPPQVSGSNGAPKVRANGSRTLSAGQGSERRASPKPIEEMTADEERIALIEAAAEARRTGG